MNTKQRIIVLTIFAIAMGMLEAAVVIYLRKLFYSSGFDFPLKTLGGSTIAITELLREAATITMLWGVAYLYGKNFISRFAAFLYSFALWDIFYYVFLKLIIGWPESIFTWDVLFLIPITWVSPVITPIIVSFTMILYAIVFIYSNEFNTNPRPNIKEWIAFALGSAIILVSFTYHPLIYMLESGNGSILNLNSEQLFSQMSNYIPQTYAWWIFWTGEFVLILGIITYHRRNQIFTTDKSEEIMGSSFSD